MSFYGESFSYNGISCEEFGLMLYDFNTTAQGNSKFASRSLKEERIPSRYRTLFYGAQYDKPLEFTLVFGQSEYAADKWEPIDRYEMQKISGWLMGYGSDMSGTRNQFFRSYKYQKYGWLTIDQPDMEGVGYRCIINNLETIEAFGDKRAFKCTVHCDSPYAYTIPEYYSFSLDVNSSPGKRYDLKEVSIFSKSTMFDPYFPQIEINVHSGDFIAIANTVCDDMTSSEGRLAGGFNLSNLPSGCGRIVLDGERGVLSCESGVNIYNCCNFSWPRLMPGENKIWLQTNGKMDVAYYCQYPVNVGG